MHASAAAPGITLLIKHKEAELTKGRVGRPSESDSRYRGTARKPASPPTGPVSSTSGQLRSAEPGPHESDAF